ncbi:MAG: DUF3783 domain-containing protein [Desulfomonilia bacterium]
MTRSRVSANEGAAGRADNQSEELFMDTSPRVLIWNYTCEEMLALDAFFQAIGAPEIQVIEPGQGSLTIHEILFSDRNDGQECQCSEKIMLFYRVDPKIIHRVMHEAADWKLPQSIHAVVTGQSIGWTFSELSEHLVKEHEYIRARSAEQKKKKHTCPHSGH